MNERTLERVALLAAVTGMRSMAGAAVLASRTSGVMRPVMTLAAAGEMIADKMPWVGDRTDALPLAGRMVMGAAVGALIAREEHQNPVLAGMLGAAIAYAAAHLAYQTRKRLPLSPAAGGLIEDALVIAVARREAGGARASA